MLVYGFTPSERQCAHGILIPHICILGLWGDELFWSSQLIIVIIEMAFTSTKYQDVGSAAVSREMCVAPVLPAPHSMGDWSGLGVPLCLLGKCSGIIWVQPSKQEFVSFVT